MPFEGFYWRRAAQTASNVEIHSDPFFNSL
jgi:hypothetical protein